MPSRTINDGYYVDNETGEIIPVAANTSLMSAEERDGYKRRVAKGVTHRELVAVQKELCGDFYWTLFESKEAYYPDVSDSMLAKIVYLITYMDYETNLLMIQDSSTSPKRPMLKSDVAKIIRLYRSKFSKFWKEMLATGIIAEEEDGKLRVCSRFCKGDLTRKNMAAMKIFTHAVRYVYENVDVRSQQYLAYLFRLIPYINLKYNILCHNPFETDKGEILRMTVKDMCHILGVDDTNAVRFMRHLLRKLVFVDTKGDTRSVVMFVSDSKNDELRSFVLVNPQFYAGFMNREDMLNAINEFKQDESLIEFFAP